MMRECNFPYFPLALSPQNVSSSFSVSRKTWSNTNISIIARVEACEGIRTILGAFYTTYFSSTFRASVILSCISLSDI